MDFAKNENFQENRKKHKLFLMLSKQKGIFDAHNCFGHFLDFWGFDKNTTKIGKTVNFGNFRKMPPPHKRIEKGV